jgi:hypothetical protein
MENLYVCLKSPENEIIIGNLHKNIMPFPLDRQYICFMLSVRPLMVGKARLNSRDRVQGGYVYMRQRKA